MCCKYLHTSQIFQILNPESFIIQSQLYMFFNSDIKWIPQMVIDVSGCIFLTISLIFLF